MASTGQYAMRGLRKHVFEHIQTLQMSYFDVIPVGRLVTRATNDVENVAEMFAQDLVALITDVIKMVGYALILFALSPKLATWAFAIVPVLAVAAVIFRLKVREAFREVRVRIARINTYIQESVTGMKVVQLFSREARNMAEFDAMNADHRDAWNKSIRYDSLLFATVEVATGITMAVILGVGTGVAEVGIMYVFIDYMQRFFMPLRDLSAKYSVMQSAMAGAERIFQVLDTAPEVADLVETAAVGRPEEKGLVEFDHVWFSYGDTKGGETEGRSPDDIDWILQDVSFRVEVGEKVAFVGATGAGKTTIIKLLTRLYDVDRGCVRVDGIDVRDIPNEISAAESRQFFRTYSFSAEPWRAISRSVVLICPRAMFGRPRSLLKRTPSSKSCPMATEPRCWSAARTFRPAKGRSCPSLGPWPTVRIFSCSTKRQAPSIRKRKRPFSAAFTF